MTFPFVIGASQQKRHNSIKYSDFALSVRKLITGYSGYCIKVRRSSDNTTQDIGFSDGVLDTASLLTFCGAGDGFVHTWYDQSGRGNHATQTTTANQPRIVSGGVVEVEDGKPIINFGTQSNAWYLLLPAGLLYNTTDITFCFVAKIHDLPNTAAGVFGPSNTSQYGFQITQQYNIGRRSLLTTNSTKRNDNANESYQLWKKDFLSYTTIFGDGSSLNVYKNGSAVALTDSSGIASLNFNGVYSIGLIYSTANLYGKIHEIWCATQNLIADRTNIETNIENFYGVADLLNKPSLMLSLRKIVTDYSGYCIKVRRSSDNTTQDIGFSDGVLDTASLLTFCGAGDGFVHTWYDQSGRGNHATQTTTANQPRIVNSGSVETENSLPIINFGTNSNAWYLLLPAGLLFWETEFSYFQVAKITDFAKSNAGVFGPSTSNSTGLEILKHTVVSRRTLLRINNARYNDNANAEYQMWNNNVLTLTSILATSDENSVFKNGASVSLTKTNGIPALNYNGVYAIGRYAGSYYMSGKISELQIFYTYQTDNRESIESGINSYYSIY